jgi:hypothetical protein
VTFHGYTITPAGKLFSYRVHESGQLVRAAVAVFSRMLAPGEEFRTRVPSPGTAVIDLQWTARSGAALATFYANDVPISTSLLLSGGDTEREHVALAAFQQLIEEFCERVALEPARDAEEVTDRPVILSVPWPSSPLSVSRATEDHESMELVSDMKTCLAAAFFEQMAGQVGDLT